ncbi:MAG: dolichol kinase [Staphylothermus sp.]|nr:dolichol kinase [Staphylothermus sp.]
MDLVMEGLWAGLLFLWVLFVVQPLTRWTYNVMRKRGMTHIKAVYYNRKIIHILAGGVAAFLVPYLFTTPLYPGVLATVLAIATYLPHKKNKLMDWFQTEDNMYEVHFCITWGLVISLGWLIFKNWWYGVIPVSFMAFGDGVTGIIRNMMYNKRTKSWIGNLAMAAVTIPLGYIALGNVGALAGLLASIVEHFEVTNIIDDNITVPLTSFLTILVGSYIV